MMIRSLLAFFLLSGASLAQGPVGTLITELNATHAEPNLRLGEVLDVSGSIAVVGAWRDDTIASDAGAVFVYFRHSGVWGLEAKLFAGDADNGDHFGESVAVDGNRLVVGAIRDDEIATNGGAAYVFERSPSGVWTQQQKLLASNGATGDEFGRVAIDGTTIVVGSPEHDAMGMTSSGAAYVFVLSAGTWVQQARLERSSPGSSHRLGLGTAVSGNLALLAYQDGGQLFGRVGTLWVQGPALAWGGASTTGIIDLQGSTAIIGDQSYSSNRGAIRVFEASGTSWPPVALILAEDSSSNDFFGCSARIDGDTIAGGAYDGDLPFSGRGAAYISKRVAGTWQSSASYVDITTADTTSEFGIGVALDGSVLIVGDRTHTHDGASSSGGVFAVDLQDNPQPEFCFGDGPDSFGCTPCPCNNDAPAGTRGGCLNSVNQSARLFVSGLPRITNDTLRFDLEGATVLTFAMLVSADSALPILGPCPPGTGITGGPPFDGLRCVGQQLLRQGVRPTNFDGDSITPWGGPGNEPAGGLLAEGGYTVGQTRHWQAWYREDAALGCGNGVNTSQGVSVTFAP